MNISHSRFILFNLKIFGEIGTTFRNRLRNGKDGFSQARSQDLEKGGGGAFLKE